MLLPESMSRIVIVGTKSHMDEAIEALYSTESIHLIDQTVDADEGFTLGTPRPYSPKASERLLKVRSMEKELGITNSVKTDAVPEAEIKSKISSDSVELVETEVNSVIDKRNDLNQRITELNATKKNLELLSDIPVDLELYSGYQSIFSMVGTVVDDPTSALSGVECEVFSSFDKKKGNVVAVFAKVEDKEKVQTILSNNGFSEIAVPNETGSAASAMVKIDSELTAANNELENVNKEIKNLLEKHKTFLRASDEELSIMVQKGEIPVRIANSEYTFVVDAWVPANKAESIKAEIESKVEGTYVEVVEAARGRSMKVVEEAEERFKTTPTKFKNGKTVGEFEYATKLVSVPKYQEVDPSLLIAIFLPLFFGLMVGDVGYAIPFIILGAYGLKTTRHKDWRAIATVLFFGGIWAFIFGFFFFGECLGMHFVTSSHMLDVEYSWEMLLGLHGLPEIFNGILPYEAGVGKLFHVGFLLKLSVYIGIVHLMIGYLCAFYNKAIQHGFKHGFMEKGSWIMGFLGIVFLCYALTEVLIYGNPFGDVIVFLALGIVLIVLEIVMNIKHEGIQAILELPGIMGNILSYTRLAAIGMSKAGMALAFNYIALGMMAGVDITPAVIDPATHEVISEAFVTNVFNFMDIVGLLMFSFLHLMIWTLAILSAGLHGLRLQMVELMGKFFEGGGVEYNPLKIKREKTISDKVKSTKEV